MRLPALPLAARPANRNRTTGITQRQVSPAVTGALQRLARTERTTMFAVALAGYYATLHRLTGQDDLAVTSLFANRAEPRSTGTVGFLANMVVLRSQVPARATFGQLVTGASATVRNAFLHERLPYQLLPGTPTDVGGQRPEDVVFQMLGEPIKVTTRVAGLELEGMVPRGVARFDLELAVIPHESGLQVQLFYASDRLDHADATVLADTYVDVITAAAGRPTIAMSALAGRPGQE